MTDAPTYDSLNRLAAELGRPVGTLITNANSDPFYAGVPARRAWAEWFANLWRQFRFGHGVHLRRIHYVFVSTATPILDVNGKPYLNRDICWNNLKAASRDARYLGIVPIEAFVDQRTDEAVIHFDPSRGSEASVTVAEIELPWVPSSIDETPFEPVSFESLALAGALPAQLPTYEFEPPVIAQRFHVEIWSEKSTIADVLIPLARTYGLNVVMGAGDMSVTQVHQFVERAVASGRPVVILYVSDFDPQGHNMPVGVARKIDFFNRTKNLNLDVRLLPVALTHDQCIEHELPRIPLKDTALGKGSFEERFGEGATELDALEALRPGELRRILIEAIGRYYDTDLDDRVDEAVEAFKARLDATETRIIRRHRNDLELLRHERRELNENCQRSLEPIIERCNQAIEACNSEAAPILEQHRENAEEIAERFSSILGVVTSELEDEAPDPDAFGWPEPDDGDDPDEVLFDSTRDYVAQIDAFQQHRGKPTERKVRSDRGKPQKRVLKPRGRT
jgi:hypothetical protein